MTINLVNMFGANPSYERQPRVNFFANPGEIPPVGTPVARTDGQQYSQYDNALQNGHNGADQYLKGRGYCNTICVA